MIASISAEFIAELDKAVHAGTPERRCQILRSVTGLFLASAERLDAAQIAVFDDVFARLLGPVDPGTLARFSSTLSDLKSAPAETVRSLAFHEDAAIATPVLFKSESLSDDELIQIATDRSQQHLLAISGRRRVSEAVTDAILKRSDTMVCRTLAENPGARISEQGYSSLVTLAGRDDDIAESLVFRPDMPAKFLHDLLSHTTSAARRRLLKNAPASMRETIEEAITSVETQTLFKAPEQIDYSEAKSLVLTLNNTGKLNDSSVNRFAVHGQRINLVAALSLLAAIPVEAIEPLMEDPDGYGLMVACRASRLDWQTALAVVSNRKCARPFEPRELEQLKTAFDGLSLSVAERTVRYESSSNCAIPMMNRLAAGDRRAVGGE